MRNFNFKLHQNVFFVNNTKLVEAKITRRIYEESLELHSDDITEKIQYLVKYGDGDIKFLDEEQLFATKQDFINQL